MWKSNNPRVLLGKKSKNFDPSTLKQEIKRKKLSMWIYFKDPLGRCERNDRDAIKNILLANSGVSKKRIKNTYLLLQISEWVKKKRILQKGCKKKLKLNKSWKGYKISWEA